MDSTNTTDSTNTPTSSDGEPCPPLDEWTPLLLGERLHCPARHHLLDHLLRPCAVCWRRLARLATSWETSDLPLDNAPSMAVHSAALGMAGRPVKRLALMRPLHRRDAYLASGCRQAFCRLLLHEAMAGSLRPQESDNPEAFIETRLLLADPCAASLSDAQRNDLEALLAIYQAYERLLSRDRGSTDFLMNAAEESLRRGEGLAEPTVTWWTFRASIDRITALRQGPRKRLLRAAVRSLERALQRLPVADYEEQRAELLHDLATVRMQLGQIPTARRLLARADTLLERLGEVAGPYLRSIVWVAQAQAEARWAISQDDESKQAARLRSNQLFDRAAAFGFLDRYDLEPERRQLKALLAR